MVDVSDSVGFVSSTVAFLTSVTGQLVIASIAVFVAFLTLLSAHLAGKYLGDWFKAKK